MGPFDLVDTKGHGAVKMRIITPRGRAAEAQAARDDAPALLSEIEKYTGSPYPFDKLDHLALLEGAFGAIENPGLITYQQRILLAKPDDEIYLAPPPACAPPCRTRLAHQWFGDLVTMADWDDVWLSEGFATWMSLKIMDRLEPETRRVWRRSTPGTASWRWTRRRRKKRARPNGFEAQMRGVYSPFIYQKAAAVLVMLENWLGEEAFQQGIRRYLDEHRFANATTANFVDAIRASGSRDIGPELRSFFDQPGVPVITVGDALRHGSGAHRAATRPLCSRSGTSVEPLSWRLPVCVKADGLAPRCLAMECARSRDPCRRLPGLGIPECRRRWLLSFAAGPRSSRSSFPAWRSANSRRAPRPWRTTSPRWYATAGSRRRKLWRFCLGWRGIPSRWFPSPPPIWPPCSPPSFRLRSKQNMTSSFAPHSARLRFRRLRNKNCFARLSRQA